MLYLLLVPDTIRLVGESSLAPAIDVMQYSRRFQGFRIYTVHLTRLIVHWVLFAALLTWTVRALVRRDHHDYAMLVTSWGLLALGGIVIAVHGRPFHTSS